MDLEPLLIQHIGTTNQLHVLHLPTILWAAKLRPFGHMMAVAKLIGWRPTT